MAIHPFIVHNLFRDKKTQSHLKKKLLIQDKLALTNDRNRKKILIKTIPSKQRLLPKTTLPKGI
jgi:hypothetical protein